MKAKSIRGKSPGEVKGALQNCIHDGFKPTLAFVFITAVEDIDGIVAILNAAGISIFGASTSEKFTEEGIEPDGIVVLLMDMDPANFKIVLKDFESPSMAYEKACETGEAGKTAFEHPAFIISTADISIPGEEIIKGLLDKAGQEITIVGGGAGEPVNFSGTVFTNHSKTGSGLIAFIADEYKVDIKGIAVSGWKPVGIPRKITKAEGNWVYTIDDEPAIDVIKKFLGKDIIIDDKLIGLDTYPLQVQRASGKPMMRPIVFWNVEDRSVMLGAPAKEGSLFHFSLPPDFEVIDAVIESTKNIQAKEMPEADALIVFSCVGRLSQLGPLLPAEIEGLAATWNKPMAGFFSLGEFGKLDDTRPEFHGTTVSWVALKEK